MQNDAKVNCAAFHAPSNLLVVGFSNGLFGLYDLPEFNMIHLLRYVYTGALRNTSGILMKYLPVSLRAILMSLQSTNPANGSLLDLQNMGSFWCGSGSQSHTF